MVTLTRDTCSEEVFSSDTQLTRAESRKTCKRKQVRMGLENAPWATSQYPGLNDHMLQNPIMCATVQCGSASRFFSAGCHEFKFPALRAFFLPTDFQVSWGTWLATGWKAAILAPSVTDVSHWHQSPSSSSLTSVTDINHHHHHHLCWHHQHPRHHYNHHHHVLFSTAKRCS